MAEKIILDEEIEEEDLSYSGEDVAEGESTISDIPKEDRLLRTQAYDKSVSDVVNMINTKDIFLRSCLKSLPCVTLSDRRERRVHFLAVKSSSYLRFFAASGSE